MSESLIRLVSIAPTVLILFLLGLFMPKLVRREIFFGVRIPPEQIETPSLQKISAWYRNSYLLLAGSVSLFLLGYTYISSDFIVSVFGFIGLIFIQLFLYYQARQKALKVKAEAHWFADKTETVVVDTAFRSRDVLVSPWWFLIPVGLILLDIVLGLRAYPTLPDQIPTHFNLLGEPDRWHEKSLWTLLAVPFNLIWITALMFFVYRIIGASKQELRADSPEISLKQQAAFRRNWSGFIVFMNIGIGGLMSFFFLQTLQLVHLGRGWIVGIPAGFTILLLAVTLILTFRTGQGGSRIRIPEKSAKTFVTDRNDDKYWKWGLFYYNPDDPAMFVEKRFGVGWTINVANWKANAIFIGLILFIVLISLVLPK